MIAAGGVLWASQQPQTLIHMVYTVRGAAVEDRPTRDPYAVRYYFPGMADAATVVSPRARWFCPPRDSKATPWQTVGESHYSGDPVPCRLRMTKTRTA